MAISVTTIGTNANTAGATVAVTVPAGGVPSAALICVATGERSNSVPAGAVADTAGNTYSRPLARSRSNTQGSGFGAIFYAENVTALVSGNSITYTKVVNGSRSSITAFYATGIATSSAIDSAFSASAGGSTTTPSVTAAAATSQTGELIVGAVDTIGSATSGTFTQASGFATPFDEAESGTGTSDSRTNGGNYVEAGTATPTYNPTYSASTQWAAFIVAFKPVSGTTTNKSIAVTQSQTVVLAKNYGKFFALTNAQSIALRRAISHSIVVLSAQTIALRMAVAKIIPAITQGQTVTLIKTIGRRITLDGMGQTVAVSALKAFRVLMVMTNAQTVTIARSMTKIIAVLSGQSVSLRRALAKIMVPIEMAQTVALRIGFRTVFALTQGQTVALAKQSGKRIALTAMGQTVLLVRTVNKMIAVVAGQTVLSFPRTARNVTIALSGIGQVVALAKTPVMFSYPKQVLKNVIRRLYVLR